ncbi:MAG TPA: hypothetical protein PKA82_02985 [Pyrinomonadaceae bacterium]|nr:hypothetical protein [Pyrinomonadaceae bacterium]
MAPKLIASILTLICSVAIGVVIFFMMLVMMNGFSGSDAEYGLVVYIVLALVISVLMSLGAFLLTGFLLKKELSSVLAVVIAFPIFTVIGVVLKVISSLIGIGVADYVRVNY